MHTPKRTESPATGVGGQSENRLSRDEARRNHREHRHVVGVAVKAALKLRRLASRQNAPSALNFETKAPAFAPGRRPIWLSFFHSHAWFSDSQEPR